jgi:hypothetical protein
MVLAVSFGHYTLIREEKLTASIAFVSHLASIVDGSDTDAVQTAIAVFDGMLKYTSKN